jgi:hypothetical protein
MSVLFDLYGHAHARMNTAGNLMLTTRCEGDFNVFARALQADADQEDLANRGPVHCRISGRVRPCGV